jgi:5-methyltetrahydropteroyltriglutamate--homocysteine methyltransferase
MHGGRGWALPEEVAETIRETLAYVPPERLFPCTNCGMAPH